MQNSVAVIPAFDFRKAISIAGDKIMTSSLKVAEYFGKRHDNVLRKIRQVIDECPNDFAALHFEGVDYIDKNGDIRPAINMDKDGYMLVVMGFSGKEATQIKVNFINAFNWMANRLNQLQMLGEQAQHEYVIKERVSKCKATIGSHLMHRRRKEIPLLRNELERVQSLTTPDLFCGLLQ